MVDCSPATSSRSVLNKHRKNHRYRYRPTRRPLTNRILRCHGFVRAFEGAVTLIQVNLNRAIPSNQRIIEPIGVEIIDTN